MLSRVPGPVPGHIVPFRSIGTLRQAFADQGRADWETFLSLRAAELRPGGRLVICLPALDESGLHPAAVLFDAANFVFGEMLTEGGITADERERMCIAAYPRTPAETLAAFTDGGSRVGLQLVKSSFSQLEDGGWAIYRKDGNAEALAARRAGFFRATFAPSLASALNQSGDEAARRAFADRLESGMRRLLSGNLATIKNIVAILSLAKI